MFGTVQIPVWALVLLVLFAAVTFASHFLFPSVRWFFRRRMEKVVARLNERLERPIEPFKLARRHDMIQRLIYDPEVSEAIVAHARETGVPENVAFQQARRYAREIVPSFSASVYFGFAIRLARWLSNTLYRVRIAQFEGDALAEVDKDATVIYVINHRSNMDYVLVTYLAADRAALSYAVGEWARVWPLRSLIKAMGGYFIRRRSRNALYRKVLARYVQEATKNGVTQAFFPEGGLSLTGAIAPPRLGLLSYIIEDFDPEVGRDVVFVPVALNYDRVLEDRVLLEAAQAGERRFRFSVLAMTGFILRQIRMKIQGRFPRFGFAAVSFGAPVSLRDYVRTCEGEVTRRIGVDLMAKVRNLVPVLPVPLVATVMADADGPIPEDVLQDRALELANELKTTGAYVHLVRGTLAAEVSDALIHLKARGLLEQTDEGWSVPDDAKRMLNYYATSISHLKAAIAA